MSESCSADVFVYGTLKAGQPNHEHMAKQGVLFNGRGVTEVPYQLVVASQWNLPFLLYLEGRGKNIKGEIYKLTSEQLSWLDDFEGHPNLYERDKISVHMTENKNGKPMGESISCWCYFMKSFSQELLNLPFLDTYDNASMGEDTKYNSDEDVHHKDEL